MRLLLALIALLVVAAHLTHPSGRFTRGGLPHGDGLYHYAQVRSLVLDRDLRLGNDYALVGNPHGQPVGDDGWAGNHFSIGTALLWVPSFVVAHTVARLGTASGAIDEPGNGTGARVQRWTVFGSAVLGWLALVLCARMLRVWYAPRVVGVAIVLTGLCTPLWWYMTRQPSASHAASAFAVAGLLHALVRRRAPPGFGFGAIVGAWIALVVLVRPQDVVVVIVVLVAWGRALVRAEPGERMAWVRVAIAAVVVATAGCSLQAWVWWKTYGSPWVIPQGPEFMRWGDSQWDLVLWSSRGGLLPWSPGVAVALLGLAIASVRGERAPVARTLVLVFVLAVWICGVVDDWWGGWSFGARRLVGLTPIFAFGWAVVVAAVLRRRSMLVRIGVAVVTIGFVRVSMQMQDDYLMGRALRGRPQAMAPMWSRALGVPLDGVFAVTGTPGSWPASWVFAARTGAAAGRYDEVAGWALVVARGDAKHYERLWLDDPRWGLSGFGPPTASFRREGRAIEGGRAAIAVPLRQPLRLHGRVRVWAQQEAEVTVRGFGPEQSMMVRPGTHDYALRPVVLPAGLNVVALHVDAAAVGVVFLDVFEPGHDPMQAH